VPANIRAARRNPDERYPWVLSTGRVLEHWHTGAMTRRSAVLDELEPEAMAFLAPRELERLGILRGDMIRVSTRRGVIELKVRADFRCARRDGVHSVLLCRGGGNLLTNPALDPVGKIPEIQSSARRRSYRSKSSPKRRLTQASPMAQLSDDCFAFGGELLGIDVADR